jgi:hypothetical protein
MLCLLLLLTVQDVEKLGSERAEEREAAGRALLELGQKARPLLEEGAKHADLEIAGRARDLLAALDRRLESFSHVLGRLRRDSPTRFLRDAAQGLRERCRGREWTDIQTTLEAQGFRLLESQKGQYWTSWRYLAREGELVVSGLRLDLELEFETAPRTSKDAPTKIVLRRASAAYRWKGTAEIRGLRAPEGLFSLLFDRLRGSYPIVERLEIEHRLLGDRWMEFNPWAFYVTAHLTDRERSAGSWWCFLVPSGLDPLQDHRGVNAPGPFTPADTLGEWRSLGRGAWTAGGREPTTLRRAGLKQASTSSEPGAVAHGAGDLKTLPEGTSLLMMEGEEFEEEDGALLLRFPNLRTLTIKDARVRLPPLPELESLYVGGEDVDDAALKAYAACPKLKHLSLVRAGNLSDAGVAHLKGLKTLESLSLGWAQFLTDEGVRSLSGLKKLSLWGVEKLTDRALEHLGTLTGLEELTLGHSHHWTAAGIAQLETLRSLRTLQLNHASIDDEGLKSLGQLPNLEELGLNGLKITDAGLLHLKGLSKLRSLHLHGCGSAKGLEALRATLPGEYVLE